MKDVSTRPNQAAVIPVRRGADGTVQVCLIRRKKAVRWSIPKGYIERAAWSDAALTEAREEAGLEGRLLGDEIVGTYEYDKGDVTLTVAVGVMEVFDVRPTWHEMRWRERQWYSIDEAAVLLEDHPVRHVFDRIRAGLAAMLPDPAA